ncbi:MAG: SDR family NAD(P)-dependent oxidoreductase [Anaerolineae bacterium]
MLTQKTVLVTGATGFLGGHLVARLSQDGVTVKALARRPERIRYIRDLPGVEVAAGDITDAARMKEVMHGVDVVFHVAAAMQGDLAAQRRGTVDGTHSVAQAAAEAQVERFVHVSTISVYGYRYRHNITEGTPHDPGADPYHVTKSEAEGVVRSTPNLRYSIIRPGMIYGPRSITWTKTLFNLARQPWLVFVGDGSGAAFPIYVEDVVDLLVTAAVHPAAEGEAFHCTPDPSPTWREFLSAYAALAGRERVRWLGIPPALLRPVGWLVGNFAPRHAQAKDLPDLIGFLMDYKTYSMAKALTLLGWQPRVSLAEGVQRCAPYLQEKGLLP